MAEEKVTVRYESDLDNLKSKNTDNLLLSGPIELFATVDTFEELFSDELLEAIKNDNSGRNIIVFVRNVTNIDPNKDPSYYGQSYRGAYFSYTGELNKQNKLCDSSWQEILLGTHSHDNIQALDSIGNLAFDTIKDGGHKVVLAKSDGTFELGNYPEGSKSFQTLPALPSAIQEKLKEYEEYKKYKEPTSADWNHLDAPLEELTDTYDWLRPDKNGVYKNIAVGNCREIYRALYQSNKKLWLNKNYEISEDGKSGVSPWLEMEVYEANFNIKSPVETAVNATNDPTNSLNYLVTLDMRWNLLDSDQIFVFIDGEILDEAKYVIRSKKDCHIIIAISKVAISDVTKLKSLTVVIARDASLYNDFRFNFEKAVAEKKFNLSDINEKLVELYIAGQFANKPNITPMYLMADSYGNINWSNQLLPTQTFYASTKVIDSDYIAENTIDGKVKVVFENANYNAGSDYPLLMVNEFFAFNVAPTVDEDNTSDVIYYIPKETDNSHYDLDLQPGEKAKITLVIIRQSTGQDISDELSRNYVTKDEAVGILSHGKLNLSDYAKNSDLLGYSKLGHTHNQYALKGHNHDDRYAMFHHTHPELIQAVIKIIEDYTHGDESEISKKFSELTDEKQNLYENYVRSLLETAGFKISYDNEDKTNIISIHIEDGDIKLTPDTISDIQDILKIDHAEDIDFTDLTVAGAIKTLVKLFERDTVLLSQVQLDHDIPVKLKNGSIGGIDTQRTYKAGSSLKTIIEDMLNPFVTVSEARKRLTPTKPSDITLKFYHYDTPEGTSVSEIEHPDQLQYDELKTETLLFTVTPKQQMEVIQNGVEVILKPELTVLNSKGEVAIGDTKYYIYDKEFNYFDVDSRIYPIQVSYKPDTQISDNYGIDKEPITTGTPNVIEITPELKIKFPDIMISVLSDDTIDFDNMDKYILTPETSELVKTLDLSDKTKRIITILMSQDSPKMNIYSSYGDLITDMFEVGETIEFKKEISYYTPYRYRVDNNNIKNVKLIIRK